MGDPIRQAYTEFAPSNAPGVSPREPTVYGRRPESQSSNQRMAITETATQKKAREDFG
ncbi:hypothetical protein [Streptomyces acidicola]|uniref:hypothetical protein n=1 Tax=Streptomyces acidicola TaxID=2596892 RepID=UPI0037F107D3